MAASLDDVVTAIKSLEGILEDIRDNGAGAGGDLPGGAGAGAAPRTGRGGALSGLMGKGPLGAALGGAKAAMAGARMASNAMDTLGLTAGLRASNLGASGGESFSRGRRAFMESALDLPFAGFAGANTRQELGAQGAAQGRITNFTDAFALAGGTRADMDQGALDDIIGREQELQRNKFDLREMVSNRAAVVGDPALDRAVGRDASNAADLLEPLSALNGNIMLLVSVLRQAGNSLGASAR